MLKKDLRTIFKNKRDELLLVEIHRLSANIEINLLALLSQLNFKTVNCFLSSDGKKEVNTRSIIHTIIEQGAQMTVPFSNYKNNNMTAVVFEKGDQVIDDNFGIPSPVKKQSIDPLSIDVVIVPLLCFDKNGYRCGYGKGMYDRFLSDCKKEVITIGVSFFPPITEISDINEQDIPLNYVVSEKEVTAFE
jgi:5-formyltetrahydrofolate cyclo-ligase